MPASSFELSFEVSTGTTDDAAATFVDLLAWNEAVVQFRRRAPHGLAVRIPRDGTHRPTEFVACREIRIKRNGAWWWAGLMDAASIPGGSKGREIVLPGWGNAAALTLHHNSPSASSFGVTFGPNWTANDVISALLDDFEQYSAGDWFPSGGRTIGTAGTTFAANRTFSGVSALEVLYQMADVEGWSCRFGINAAGTFTAKISGTVDQDLTASIHLYDGASGVDLVDYSADGHAIVSLVRVLCRTPNIRQQLNGALVAGNTTVTCDDTNGLQTGDWVFIGEGTANKELKQITVTSGTQFTVSALANNHADNELVQTLTDNRWRGTNVSGAGTINDAYHTQVQCIMNDQLVSDAMRTAVGDAYLAAYDHPLVRATYRVTDRTMIETILDAGLEPGDSIKATSDDPDLTTLYSNTTVQVQDMTVTLRDGVCVQIDLVLGDPALDDYATLERSIAAGKNAANAVFAT